jgi:hypothetical protein
MGLVAVVLLAGPTAGASAAGGRNLLIQHAQPAGSLGSFVLSGPAPVTVSDGTEITAEDIASFDAQWMQPSDRANSLGGAAWQLNNRFGGAVWGTSERMRSLARMYELTHEQRYLDDLHGFIEAALHYRDDRYPG